MEKTKEITVLLFDQECPVWLGSLLKMFYPPLKFLEKQKNFGFFITTRGHDKKVSFADTYRVSEQKDGYYAYYKDKNQKTDRIVYRRIRVDKNFKEFFFQPLSEYRAFCNMVVKVVDSIRLALEDPGNELEKLFEDFKDNRARKIASAQMQDFEEAAAYRDKERLVVGKIQDYLRESVPGDDLDKALDYILKKYDEIFQ
ncbi:MAG: hypothetical protein Q8N57_02855 [bacterium]|nr:hypothetical protein [bacterium]